jgi:acid phosphatase type 7
MKEFTRLIAWLCLAVLACSGTEPNEEGDIAAEKTGSIMTGLAPRHAADRELVARCGSGAYTKAGSATLTRAPFLQQVSSSSALVVFRSTSSESEAIDVTTVDGSPVMSAVAGTDAGVKGGSQKVAQLRGLQPSTTYCYALRGLTERAGLRTAPAPGSGATVRFAVWGDSGYGGSDQATLFGQIMTVPFDFVLHAGDLAYDAGTRGQFERTVFKVYAPLLRQFAIFPVSGNHEYETEQAAPYLESFVLPENGDHERYYSFDWGDVHFVGLDTERIGTPQAEWLDADLMKNRLPWTIVIGHRPPYSSGEHGGDDDFRSYFIPVLEKYQVPLVLSGHEHQYERTHVLNGVTYIVTGGGGRGTRPVGSSSFTAFAEAVIHFLFVEARGNRLVVHAIDGVGREFDQTVIERSAS